MSKSTDPPLPSLFSVRDCATCLNSTLPDKSTSCNPNQHKNSHLPAPICDRGSQVFANELICSPLQENRLWCLTKHHGGRKPQNDWLSKWLPLLQSLTLNEQTCSVFPRGIGENWAWVRGFSCRGEMWLLYNFLFDNNGLIIFVARITY